MNENVENLLKKSENANSSKSNEKYHPSESSDRKYKLSVMITILLAILTITAVTFTAIYGYIALENEKLKQEAMATMKDVRLNAQINSLNGIFDLKQKIDNAKTNPVKTTDVNLVTSSASSNLYDNSYGNLADLKMGELKHF